MQERQQVADVGLPLLVREAADLLRQIDRHAAGLPGAAHRPQCILGRLVDGEPIARRGVEILHGLIKAGLPVRAGRITVGIRAARGEIVVLQERREALSVGAGRQIKAGAEICLAFGIGLFQRGYLRVRRVLRVAAAEVVEDSRGTLSCG